MCSEEALRPDKDTERFLYRNIDLRIQINDYQILPLVPYGLSGMSVVRPLRTAV